MPYVSEFATLAVIHFLAVVAPGPDFAITVSQSVRFGRRIGIITALGIGLGISVHVIYTLLGVGALMHATPWLMEVAKFVGAAYITYLGVKLVRAKPRGTADLEFSSAPDVMHPRRAFSIGFLTNATNPKATIFFLAIFTTIVSSSTPLYIQMLYGAWMCSVNAIWFSLVGLFFSNRNIRLLFLRSGHWFERVMGILLILFALRLLLIS